MKADAPPIENGYKHTEVGIIPEDWDTKPCADLSTLITVGIVIRPTQYYTPQGVPALRSANVRESGIDPQDMVFITEKANALLSKSQLKAGDVVTVRTGYPGTSAVVPVAYSGANCIDILITRPKKTVSSQFLAAWINSPPGKNQVLQNQGGLAQQHFNVGELRELVVAVPPTRAEQEAIAGALSDADALIESLEQLLAKKCDIKQGAMQELLTGNTRLPGFTTPWHKVHLRDLLSFERPDKYIVQNTDYLEHGDVPVLTANKSFILGYTNEDFGICSETPAIVFDDFTTDSKFADFPFKVKSSAIKLLRPRNASVNLRYVFDRMQLIHFPLGDHKRYYISEYQHQELPVPQNNEQCAIAAVLCDMTAEIDALEQKLFKARQIKQGMMQELLTGRIRLV